MQSLTRTISISLMAIVTGFSWTTKATGQEAAATGRTTNETAADATRLRRAQLPFAKGTLLSNDLLRRLMKVKTEDGTRTFIYTEHTYIFRNKEKITSDKLVVGEIIALRFETDSEGRSIVLRIKAYGPTQPAANKSSDASDSTK